jgi:hypothetical protein
MVLSAGGPSDPWLCRRYQSYGQGTIDYKNIRYIFVLQGGYLALFPILKKMLSCLCGGTELLGIKWLPSLSMSQAKELTPFEVGHKQWKASVHTLTLG